MKFQTVNRHWKYIYVAQFCCLCPGAVRSQAIQVIIQIISIVMKSGHLGTAKCADFTRCKYCPSVGLNVVNIQYKCLRSVLNTEIFPTHRALIISRVQPRTDGVSKPALDIPHP